MNTLTKAKAALILDQPFFATLLMGMRMTEDKSIKTLATDGQSIIYNPEFMATLSLNETVFVLAHEVMHCVFEHMYTRGARNHNRWNIAADYIINDILTRDKVGSMPKGALLNASLVAKGDYTTAGVYDLLPPSTEKKDPGEPGGSLDDCRDDTGESDGNGEESSGGDNLTPSQRRAQKQIEIIQAINTAKAHGKLSAGLARIVADITETRTDWRVVLRRFLSERAKIDYSFARPKRRWLAEDINLPSLVGERMGEVVIAVDCSGSIGDTTLAEFEAELKAIGEDVQPSLIRVLYFDTAILRADEFTADDTLKLDPIGGGGTAFSPIFRYLDDAGIIPAACVVLTDLECSDFGDAPTYPVLWASIAKGHVPFGQTVIIRKD